MSIDLSSNSRLTSLKISYKINRRRPIQDTKRFRTRTYRLRVTALAERVEYSVFSTSTVIGCAVEEEAWLRSTAALCCCAVAVLLLYYSHVVGRGRYHRTGGCVHGVYYVCYGSDSSCESINDVACRRLLGCWRVSYYSHCRVYRSEHTTAPLTVDVGYNCAGSLVYC